MNKFIKDTKKAFLANRIKTFIIAGVAFLYSVTVGPILIPTLDVTSQIGVGILFGVLFLMSLATLIINFSVKTPKTLGEKLSLVTNITSSTKLYKKIMGMDQTIMN